MLRGGKKGSIRLSRSWGHHECISKAASYMKTERNIMKCRRHIIRIMKFLKHVERQEELNSKTKLLNENYFICLIRLTGWMLNLVTINPYSSILILRHDFHTEGFKKTPFFSLRNVFILDRTSQNCHQQTISKIISKEEKLQHGKYCLIRT